VRRQAITSPLATHPLSIGDVAAQTGVPVTTLRTWESRYGVPVPHREMSGHRRYSDADVDLVLEVLRQRASGLAMPAAVERARAHSRPADSSVFAGLRNRHRELTVQRLGKPMLLALCRAIEDECCAQADRPLLFAAFQRVRHYRASRQRWQDLSGTARGTFVFADFERPGAVSDQPLEVAVPGDAALNREWLLVCDSEDYPGCVVGWEPPGQRQHPDRLREFETLWSLDPAVVRDASRICAGLVEQFRPEVRFPFWRDLEQMPPQQSVAERRTSHVFDRMLSYFSAASKT
jgi:MerR family transcriptional regulator, light-induced transcriptional regulator